MIPSRELWQSIPVAAAADTAYLAAAGAMHVHLAAAPFLPVLDLDLASLVEATFTGSTAKNAGTGVQPTFFDVQTGAFLIQLLEPAGGWSWQCTVDPVVPETIYGFFVTDNADAVLLGSMLLPAPVTIVAAGQGLTVPRVTLSFNTTSPY